MLKYFRGIREQVPLLKYGVHANISAEKKMWVAFAFEKATHIFSAKIHVN